MYTEPNDFDEPREMSGFLRNCKPKYIEVTDSGPPSMLIVPASINCFAANDYIPLESKFDTLFIQSHKRNTNMVRMLTKWKPVFIETKYTQTDNKCWCGNRYSKEMNWLHKSNTNTKTNDSHYIELGGKIHFSNPKFTPNFEQRQQLEQIVQNTPTSTESSNESNINVGESSKLRDAEFESNSNNYKQIFKEIFLILQN